MKRLLLLLTCCFLFSLKGYSQQEKYSRVRIWTNESGLLKLSTLGIETDHGDIRKGVWLTSDFSASEISRIEQAGFRTEILIDDVQQHYIDHLNNGTSSERMQSAGVCATGAPSYPVPANFSLGSMGGYFTYQEMLDNLDSMASKYPNLITIKAAIPGGTTIENRPVYWVKISDNPNVDETEPEMLYTAVHHAREPGGMSQLIFYMWHLLENYSSGGEIGSLVDNTEMYFIPCINPDGYIFNETNFPGGGGMWRKNRRDNQDGTFGVDLNRNYGYNWGFDDFGSSPDGMDETYRGSAPFSEPETQLVSSFVNSRNFSMALNYHTYGNLLIYPWGYDYSIYTPDSAIFADFGRMLTEYNSYTYGTADQTVGYIVNGSSDDWMYGEQTVKPKVFAMTPETGDAGFGFWPPSNEIIPICQSNMYQNILAAQLCGRYASLTENSPELITQGGGYVRYNFKQLGLDTTGTYTVSITALTPNIVQTGGPKSYSNLSPGQSFTDSIFFALTTPMTNGEAVTFLLSIDNGLFVHSDTVNKFFGTPATAFFSNCNNTSGWTINQWGISTTEYYSPSASITDSPSGNYGSNDFKIVQNASAIDLTTAVKARLTFYAKWALETNYDFVQVRASSDNGNTWIPLCGKYTVPGSLFQDPDEPVYEGFQQTWVQEEISLDDFLGQNILISFMLLSDGWLEYDGFYYDDLLVEKILPGTNSIEETPNNYLLTVSPNPAGSYFDVNFSKSTSQSATIILTDITGRIVKEQHADAGTSRVSIAAYGIMSGVYFVQAVSAEGTSAPVRLIIR